MAGQAFNNFRKNRARNQDARFHFFDFQGKTNCYSSFSDAGLPCSSAPLHDIANKNSLTEACQQCGAAPDDLYSGNWIEYSSINIFLQKHRRLLNKIKQLASLLHCLMPQLAKSVQNKYHFIKLTAPVRTYARRGLWVISHVRSVFAYS
ncbi:hypothetical protein [Undibacterium sp.]|uniref:hypothetical protein n=1 Tax=Undibacterium sp. TaxID=1914977 RepID=UPI002C09CD46|nr:hypothetical protein [Undibacterium sp.]HTD06271.1 hypothetical protein [Undibacterium sp.]